MDRIQGRTMTLFSKLNPLLKPPAGFLEWARTRNHTYDARVVVSEIAGKLTQQTPPRPTSDAPQVFLDEISSNFFHGRSVACELNQHFLPTDEYNISFSLPDHVRSPNIYLNIGVPLKSISLANLSIIEVLVQTTTTVVAENCWISNLTIRGALAIRLTLKNCWLGHLNIDGPSCLSDTIITGGGILHFLCPAPTGAQPLTASFVLSRSTYLPTKSIPGFIQGPQSYRSLYSKLAAMGNHQVAGIIRRKEECLERESDSRSNRFFSYLYQYASDFGSSTIRPLLWLSISFVVNFLIVFLTNGAEISQEPTFYTRGWRSLLTQCDLTGQFARAFLLALDPITNPLGVFANRTLLVATHWALQIWLWFNGLLSAVLIALFVFALRRRFKIQ